MEDFKNGGEEPGRSGEDYICTTLIARCTDDNSKKIRLEIRTNEKEYVLATEEAKIINNKMLWIAFFRFNKNSVIFVLDAGFFTVNLYLVFVYTFLVGISIGM